jgi:hypothetical protein
MEAQEHRSDYNIASTAPERQDFPLPTALPSFIVREFQDKISRFYGEKAGIVHFKDGSTGQRVRSAASGDEIKITYKNERVIQKTYYRYPQGTALHHSLVNLAGQGVL